MDYTQYRAEDFAADETFVSYYLKADPQHILFWEEWIARHPQMQAEVQQAVRLLNMVHIRLDVNEMDAERGRMLQFIEQDAMPQLAPAASTSIFKLNRIQLSVAASFLVICSLGALLWFLKSDKKIAQPMLTAVSAPGEQKVITLADGSRVTLNGGSRLSYPAEFIGPDRRISFNGEALFEISKDAAHPFKVQTGKLTTTVLGTTFNINTDKGIQVSLIEGKVKLTTWGKPALYLKPGNAGMLLGNILTVKPFNKQQVQAWQSKSIVLQNASFDEIASKMHRIYGITLVSSKPARWSYTGTFDHAGYRSVINTIAYAKNLKYIVNRDTVTIK